MNVITPGVMVLVAFFILALLRVPIFMALLLPSLTYVILYDIPIILVAQRMVQTLNSFTLLAIPLFIFVGTLMDQGEVTESLFEFTSDIVGHFRGGLAQVNVLASLLFSGISGSALADVGSVGKVLINIMQDDGYTDSYSAALTSASATIGPIFPPSVPLIIFGLLAEVSVLSLLLAGVLPAILAAILLMIATGYVAIKRDFPRGERATHRQQLVSFVRSAPALLIPVLLIGGLLGGYFGPTEAAAVTVVYVILVSAVFYTGGSVRFIWDAAIDTVRINGTILVILAAAGLFNWIMAAESVQVLISGLLFSISENPVIVLLLVNLFLLVLGLFLEPIAAMVLSVPIVLPPLTELGYDPVHIGVIVTFNLMIGLLTPPLGLSIFLCADMAEVDVVEVIKELRVYYVALLSMLLLITFIPELSLFVPNFG